MPNLKRKYNKDDEDDDDIEILTKKNDDSDIIEINSDEEKLDSNQKEKCKKLDLSFH